MMKVLVIGDSCTDKFIYGKCSRLCPEGPVPVFTPSEVKENKGMAGNVWRNVTAITGEPCELYTNEEVITKTRYIDQKSNSLLLRVDENDRCSRIKHKLEYGEYDVILISDYNKGFLLEEDISYISERNANTFLDTKKSLGDWVSKVRFIKINELEYTLTKNTTEKYLEKLIITMGSSGCLWSGKVYPAAEKVETIDISGAGDTFLAAFAIMFAKTNSVFASINFAQKSSLTVVQKRGVSTV